MNCLPSFLTQCSRQGSTRKGTTREEAVSESRIKKGPYTASTAAMASRVPYMTAEELQKMRDPSYAIIDVRDEERQRDGHIAGSVHYPEASFNEDFPIFLKDISNSNNIVFHCAKSQVRGPKCARKFMDYVQKKGPFEMHQRVFILEHGFDDWSSNGRPVCKCKDVPKCSKAYK